MQDRRRRTALHLPPPAGPVLLPRERQSSSTGPSGTTGSSGASDSPDSGPASGSGSGSAGSGGSSSSGSADDNPFAPPPEGRPDQPWRPRQPEGAGPADDGSGADRSGWGSQWSSRQPGRSTGGFGSRPGGQNGQQNGQGGGQDGPEGGRGGGLRWDPTDPIQRRARYALLGGMWAFFFALFDFPEIALLLGSLALYWGISSLRNKPVNGSSSGQDDATSGGPSSGGPSSGAPSLPTPATGQNAPAQGPAQGPPYGPAAPAGASSRQQTTAAVSGLVTAAIALAIVAATFTVQLVYRDYYTCLNDSLTKTGQLSCNDELPPSLIPVFGVKE
ncbi:hypothetical protein [Streptomyces sp. NPDC059743]|uniref:hypothetical protein n=1 Tax=Streptomyces sp. NPDC059743 TaxID=3346928 RepID=UPI0036466BA7